MFEDICENVYIYIYFFFEYIHVCVRVARLTASVQALSQSAVPWMAPEVLQAGGNWLWILLTKILELQGESQWPMACVSSLVIFVVWNWFFSNGWWITQCCLFVFGGTPDFSLRLGGIASKHFQRYLVLGLLDGIVTSVLIALGCGFQVSIGQFVKTVQGSVHRRWLGSADLWSSGDGGWWMVTDPVDEFLDPFRCSKVEVVLGIPNFIWLSHSQKMLGVKDGQGNSRHFGYLGLGANSTPKVAVKMCHFNLLFATSNQALLAKPNHKTQKKKNMTRYNLALDTRTLP